MPEPPIRRVMALPDCYRHFAVVFTDLRVYGQQKLPASDSGCETALPSIEGRDATRGRPSGTSTITPLNRPVCGQTFRISFE